MQERRESSSSAGASGVQRGLFIQDLMLATLALDLNLDAGADVDDHVTTAATTTTSTKNAKNDAPAADAAADTAALPSAKGSSSFRNLSHLERALESRFDRVLDQFGLVFLSSG